MSKRDDRQKASEVFRNTDFLFATKTTFAKAFPTIKSVRVEVSQTKGMWEKELGAAVYDEKTVGEFVDCRNTLCYNGGVSVGEMLREMVRDNKTEAEFSRLCRGYEGSPKGRRKYRSCFNFFRVKVKTEYNPPVHIDPKQIT
jgi:hypothetical protein